MNFKLRTDRCQDCKQKVVRRETPGMSTKVVCADCQAERSAQARRRQLREGVVSWDDEPLTWGHE